ncbi:4Fe-4S binding protein, partial [Chloroflexota bacterium]
LKGRISKIYQDGQKVVVCGDDALMGRPVQIAADLVVLATGIDPSDGVVKLAQTLNISYDTNKFLVEAHPKLRPVETQTAGIFLAGVAVGPRDIPDCVAQGSAAAVKVVGVLNQDTLTTDPMTSVVDQAKCVGCFMCEDVCPFKAIERQTARDGSPVAMINETLCTGCGLCVASCRPGAINLRGYTDQQLLAEVVSLCR